MQASASPEKRRFSVARIRDHWYVAVPSAQLKDKPIPRTILETPLVVFRDGDGTAHALVDRCAHRNVPLSLGRVESGRLVCAYHGWAYDGDGVCREVPALCGDSVGKARRVHRYPAREQDGFVWVYMNPDATPDVEPFPFVQLRDRRYTAVRYTVRVNATLHATLENILDVPHTAFLHRGLFRTKTRHPITAIVRRSADRVEAEFVGEPRPAGVLGTLLSPGGGEVEHVDRFVLPSIAQVEYRLGPRNHVVVTSALTPVSDFETDLFAVATFRTVLPDRILKPIATPIGMAILEQDRRILQRQTESVQRFGREQFVSTDVDLLGPHIWRLLRQAERGEAGPEAVHEERISLRA